MFCCVNSISKKSSSFKKFWTSAIAFITCRNRYHIKNNARYKDNINNASVIIFLIDTFSSFFVFLFVPLGDLTKLPAMVLCLGEPPADVFDVDCCCCFFPYWRFLRFRTTFPCHRHSNLASQVREGLHQLWALPWLLSVALYLPDFSVTVLPRAQQFWLGIFYTQALFTLRSFLTCLTGFVTQCRQENPIQVPPLCLPSQSCPFRLTQGLELLIL